MQNEQNMALPSPGASPLPFARSIGQIFLQRNAGMGVAILIAVFSVSPRLGCALLIGASTGNLVGHIFADLNSTASRSDLHGFNGALAALAAFTFIDNDSSSGAVAILAAIAASALSAAMTRALHVRNLPTYSGPAIIVTWAWLPFVPTIHSGGPAETDAWNVGAAGAFFNGPHVDAPALFISFTSHVVAGLAPIVFATGLLAGSIILVGLVLTRPAAAFWALIGSTLGLCLSAIAGAPEYAMVSGACGFNSALAAIATYRLGTGPAVAAMGLTCAFAWVGSMIGIPLLTAPFVVASWTVQVFVERRQLALLRKTLIHHESVSLALDASNDKAQEVR